VADPFLAEIRVVGFSFAPKGWAFCGGQLLPLSQNTALFSLLGTNYGGDGKSTFALPDIQGRSVMSPGQGNGLSDRFLGEMAGSQNITLLPSEMPVHNHSLVAAAGPSSTNQAGPTVGFARASNGSPYKANPFGQTAPMGQGIGISGGNVAHNNMMPSLVLFYAIALQGVFPQRP